MVPDSMQDLVVSVLIEGCAKKDGGSHVRVLHRRFDASIVIEYEVQAKLLCFLIKFGTLSYRS